MLCRVKCQSFILVLLDNLSQEVDDAKLQLKQPIIWKTMYQPPLPRCVVAAVTVVPVRNLEVVQFCCMHNVLKLPTPELLGSLLTQEGETLIVNKVNGVQTLSHYVAPPLNIMTSELDTPTFRLWTYGFCRVVCTMIWKFS